jgi:hypothetical protein
MREFRNIYRIIDSILKRPFGRPRRRWEDNIKIDDREVCYVDVNWIRFIGRLLWTR